MSRASHPAWPAPRQVCDVLERENTTLIWDNEQIVPFAFNDNQWVGFDDERSITAKVRRLLSGPSVTGNVCSVFPHN